MPFGPRASRREWSTSSQPAPVRPDDFWGEGSAAIHDVLQAPDASERRRGRVAGAGFVSRFGRDAARAVHAARVADAAGHWHVRARERGVRVVPVPHPTIPRMRRRSAGLVAGGLVALACLAIAVGMFVGERRAPVVRPWRRRTSRSWRVEVPGLRASSWPGRGRASRRSRCDWRRSAGAGWATASNAAVGPRSSRSPPALARHRTGGLLRQHSLAAPNLCRGVSGTWP